MAADLIEDGLGMSPEDREIVTSETDVVINCAASVNFDDPLLDALQINYFGCLRMMQLARDCKNIISFCHCSTAYANVTVETPMIEEKVYDGRMDPEEQVASILALGPQKVLEQEKALIGKFPNTYTFTKNLAERALKKLHGSLPTTIVRPSIIIGCYKQPFEGWIDTISAGGGITYTLEVGLLHYVNTAPTAVVDLIPCDLTINLMLA